MLCPKCGFSQGEDAAECPSCGIIFARWNAGQQRRTPSPDVRPLATPPADAAAPRVSLSSRIVIGIIVLVFIGVGLQWTAHRRELRKQPQPDVLNEINRGFIEKSRRERVVAASAVPRREVRTQPDVELHSFPPELTESSAIEKIDQCRFFSTPASVTLPRAFLRQDHERMLREYPALLPALNNLIVVLDPPIAGTMRGDVPISVLVTKAAAAAMRIESRSDGYFISLGRPRVEQVTDVTRTEYGESIRVEFRWSYEDAAATALTPTVSMTGSAFFSRSGNSWAPVATDIDREQGGRTNQACATF